MAKKYSLIDKRRHYIGVKHRTNNWFVFSHAIGFLDGAARLTNASDYKGAQEKLSYYKRRLKNMTKEDKIILEDFDCKKEICYYRGFIKGYKAKKDE